ncbi:hypothetical protein, partial [Sulfurimonas sp.]|uniref:hypothetical protein n=1 Tax=Sulfurimonas sp. TaxID=2022749 RepID=UPI0025CDFF0F
MNTPSYLGKKTGSGIPHFIISKMPKHDVYIEPFLGTGAIMSMKYPANINIGIERDQNILNKLNFDKRYYIVNDNSLEILESTIDKYISNGSICIYLDPPYLHKTRSCLNSCKYLYDMIDDEHIKLLNILIEIDKKYKNVYLMISGYKSDLYMSMLHGWNYFETQTMSRGGKRIESLWTNFNPTNMIKHDYDYIGHNYTDRQRMKRKAKRWLNNLDNMTLDERVFILREISHSYQELYCSIDKK